MSGKDCHDSNLESAKYFTQTGNEQVVNNVISKLIFISKVKKGEKLNIKNLFVRDNNDILQRFLRTIRNNILWEDSESKQSTINFLSSVTDEALNLVSIYRQNPNNEFNNNIADMIVDNIKKALQGMESIVHTYKDDRLYSSQIETMLNTLNLRLKAYDR
jgi:hypothetical protein